MNVYSGGFMGFRRVLETDRPHISLDDGEVQYIEFVIVDNTVVDVLLRRDLIDGVMAAHVYRRV